MLAAVITTVVTSPMGAIPRLEVTAAQAASSGKYLFANGEPEATCKACTAIMEHVQRAVQEQSMPGRTRSAESARRSKLAHIQQSLDPRSCSEATSRFELARASEQSAEAIFIYRGPDENQTGAGVASEAPIGPDAVQLWAQHELKLVCENLLAEYEEELSALLASMEATTTSIDLGERVCKEQLTLCKTRRLRQPPTTMSTSQYLEVERAQHTYFALDVDRNGGLSRAELVSMVDVRPASAASSERANGHGRRGAVTRKDISLGKAREARADVNEWFDLMDVDDDGFISFREYMGSNFGRVAGRALPLADVDSQTNGAQASMGLRAAQLKSPLGGSLTGGSDLMFVVFLAIIALIIYVGGLVFRFW